MNTKSLRKKLIKAFGLSVEQNTVIANSIKTFYLSAGSGEPLVLIHGAGGGAVMWGPIIELLSKHFHIIAPDVIGYGESDKPEGRYDKKFFSNWLLGVCDALNIEKVNLLGNSQGGAIAMQFTLDNPLRVKKLILVDSAGLGTWGISPAAMLKMAAANLFPTERTVKNIVKYIVYKNDNFPENDGINYLIQVIRSSGGKRPFVNGKGRAVAPFSSEQLSQITNPALIIWGEKDRILPVKHGKKGNARIPHARLEIIPDTGHTPFIDLPEEFKDIVLGFIEPKS
jgi:4,5:9,10-diseco-3-hydroxy-5,9,17-trioxoandrosta-1(10),2-diene-4-oate hydrolase